MIAVREVQPIAAGGVVLVELTAGPPDGPGQRLVITRTDAVRLVDQLVELVERYR